MHRALSISAYVLLLVFLCLLPTTPATATTAIALRSRYRVVLAADSRAVYGAGRNSTECKLFQVQDVYATVSGLARYGTSFRATNAIRDGFSRPGSFESHVSATALSLQRQVARLMAGLERNNPREYRSLMQSRNGDFIELAVAQIIHGQPMLGIIELQRATEGYGFRAKSAICPGNCRRQAGLFYLGYWERIQPYVSDAGQPRSIGSAASIDRLIRLEIRAHPDTVAAPINILELNSSGARWLQNGGNCSLPGAGW